MDEGKSEDGGVFGDADAMRAYRHTAERQQDAQSERRRVLDFRLLATLPINGALLALVSTSLSSSPQTGTYLWVLAGFALATFGVYLFYAARAYGTHDWSERPDLKALREIVKEFPAGVVDAWIAEEISKSIDRNEPLLERKGRHMSRAYSCTLILAVLAMAIAVVARAS